MADSESKRAEDDAGRLARKLTERAERRSKDAEQAEGVGKLVAGAAAARASQRAVKAALGALVCFLGAPTFALLGLRQMGDSAVSGGIMLAGALLMLGISAFLSWQVWQREPRPTWAVWLWAGLGLSFVLPLPLLFVGPGTPTGELHLDITVLGGAGIEPTLRIDGDPVDPAVFWGEAVNGRLLQYLELPVGTHVIELEAPGYPPIRREIRLRKGQRKRGELQLRHESDP